jgi:methyl halide transferase
MGSEHPDVEFWRVRYREGRTPWDLGDVSEPVRTLVERWFPPAGRVLIPGCGRGYEALFLAARGYAVTALDLAPEPLAYLRGQARARGLQLDIRQGDMFALPPGMDAAFDVFLEQTCLCALHPRLQPDYEALAHRVLQPGGQLLGVFMRVPFADGPPFDTPAERVWELFPAQRWEREGPWPVDPPNPARPGPEYLARFVRRGARGGTGPARPSGMA